jgi:hypothetical protein
LIYRLLLKQVQKFRCYYKGLSMVFAPSLAEDPLIVKLKAYGRLTSHSGWRETPEFYDSGKAGSTRGGFQERGWSSERPGWRRFVAVQFACSSCVVLALPC